MKEIKEMKVSFLGYGLTGILFSPIRSAVLRRSLTEGVEDSMSRRMNPTEPVVAALCLDFRKFDICLEGVIDQDRIVGSQR